MSKRVLLSGYYGFGNTGDEAILESICQELRAAIPGVELSVLMDNRQRGEELGLKCYPRKSPQHIWKAMRAADLFLSGGGGLLQDSTGIGSVVYYGGLLGLAKFAGVPAVVFCQGFGPIATPASKCLCYCALKCVRWASWRDKASLDEVATLVPGLDSRLLADPALLLEPATAPRVRELYEACHGPVGRRIVVTVRKWSGLDLNVLARELRNFALKVQEEDGSPVCYSIIPFQPSVDTEPSEQLAEMLPDMSEIVRGASVREVVGLVRADASCLPEEQAVQMVVSMRLHALIFAAAGHVPCLGISYDRKVQRFCERAGGQSIELAHIGEGALAQQMLECWHGRQAMRENMVPRVEAMRQQVKQAVQDVVSLLG